MEELERLRSQYNKKAAIYITLGVVVDILLIILTRNLELARLNITITILVVGIKVAVEKDKYRKYYKENFVKNILEDIYDRVVYNPTKGIEERVLSSTGLIRTGTTYRSEDYIGASYHGINFEQSDVDITVKQGKSSRTIFKGRWMIFDFNKRFKSNVMVAQKGFEAVTTRSMISRKIHSVDKISTESESFNKRFDVYAEEGHDAFYILTPVLMERIMRLDMSHKGQLALCFHNNKLYVGINDKKDFFEPSMKLSYGDNGLGYEDIVDSIKDELYEITSFVDDLALDDDLYI
ncbi:MAG: DUF3137 domain-containing protein [Lachnospiraceae bacterium]|nr:DUF3137 domain-containing protein [Lachnospiraceae bacterium]